MNNTKKTRVRNKHVYYTDGPEIDGRFFVKTRSKKDPIIVVGNRKSGKKVKYTYRYLASDKPINYLHRYAASAAIGAWFHKVANSSITTSYKVEGKTK